MLVGRLLFAGVVLVSTAGHAAAQTSPRDTAPSTDRSQGKNTARMSGRVLAGDTGRPLRNAKVAIHKPQAEILAPENLHATSDDQGRWQIDVPPGRYSVTLSKPGYVPLSYGQRRVIDSAAIVEVAERAQIDRLDVTLPRAGAIGGRIGDENGEPVTPALVTLQRVRYVDGVRTLKPVVEGVGLVFSGGLTDDRGEYRIHSLNAGTYYISAVAGPMGSLPSGETSQLAPTFYPGTPNLAGAQPVTIAAGEEALSINFNLTRVRASTIRGVVRSAAGAPVRANVDLRNLSPIPINLFAASDESGAFSIASVPPGDYRLIARTSVIDDRAPELGYLPITVTGEDLADILVTTGTSATVTGRVVTDNGDPVPINTWIDAVGARADVYTPSNASRTTMRKDGSFVIRGLLDAHLIRAEARGWFLKSAMLQSRDLADAPYEFKIGENVSGLEVTLTRQRTVLRGNVMDEANVASRDYAVVAFSTDERRWGMRTRYIQSVAPRPTGDFSIEALPPGEYFVIALEFVEAGEEGAVERLERWSRDATRVTLGDGETASVSLKLKR
jgi:protocatechuate 3,4-dioxygenase beta subunit